MFLLVSVRHVGAHPDEHQRGVFIQISINLGKTFLRISHIRNIPLTWILARVLFSIYLLSVLRFWTLFNGFDFYFDLFWMAWHWKPAIPFFTKKSPLLYTFYWQMVSLSHKYTLFRTLHSFNCLKCTFFKIEINISQNRKFSRLYKAMKFIC